MMVRIGAIDVGTCFANRVGDFIINTINNHITAASFNCPTPGVDDHRFTVDIQHLLFRDTIFINL